MRQSTPDYDAILALDIVIALLVIMFIVAFWVR